MSSSIHDQIVDLIKSAPEGKRPSVAEVCQVLDVGASTVYRAIQKHERATGVSLLANPSRYRQLVDLIESYPDDEPLPPVTEIANELGLDKSNVYSHLKRYRRETGKALVHQRGDSRYAEVVAYIEDQPSLADLPAVADISETLGIPTKTVAAHLLRYRRDNGVVLKHRRKNSRYAVVAAYVEGRKDAGPLPPVADIAKELGLPVTSTYRYLRDYERMSKHKIEHEQAVHQHPKHEDIARMLRAGHTVAEVRRELHVSTSTVARVREEVGSHRQSSTNKVLDAIHRFHKAHGTPPTEAEVGRRLRMSRGTVAYHVKVLVADGLVADPQGRAGLSLRGSRFHEDCLMLARQTRQPGGGMPQNLRPLVAALTYPVMGMDQRRLTSKDPRQRTLAAVEHLHAREGRAVTAAALAGALSCSVDEAAWMLRQGEEFGTLSKQKVGYLPTGPDRQQAAALRLRGVSEHGWDRNVFDALERVLRVVLAW